MTTFRSDLSLGGVIALTLLSILGFFETTDYQALRDAITGNKPTKSEKAKRVFSIHAGKNTERLLPISFDKENNDFLDVASGVSYTITDYLPHEKDKVRGVFICKGKPSPEMNFTLGKARKCRNYKLKFDSKEKEKVEMSLESFSRVKNKKGQDLVKRQKNQKKGLKQRLKKSHQKNQKKDQHKSQKKSAKT